MLAIEVDKPKLREFCQKWQITEFSFFGSVTRPEEFRDDSDVDVMVQFAPKAPWLLFDIVHMRDELVALFGREVDIVERKAIEETDNRFIKRAILGTAVLYDVA